MASVERNHRQVPVNALWTNLTAVNANSVVDASRNPVSWYATGGTASFSNTGSAAGGVLLRDMGKNIYAPALTTPNAVGMTSSIYRKVQWIPSAPMGFYGVGGAAPASATDSAPYFTGYIAIGGQTYGGGTGGPTVFVRAN
jgi:hypothetical protein